MHCCPNGTLPALHCHRGLTPNCFNTAAQNLAAWAVAGVCAYYLWVKPEREAEVERKVFSIQCAGLKAVYYEGFKFVVSLGRAICGCHHIRCRTD